MKAWSLTLGALSLGLFSLSALADNDNAANKGGNNQCPVGLVSGLSLDDEFGPGAQELTRCIKQRHDVKVVVQINQFCQDAAGNANRAACTRPYALGNINNILNDYEITHGMVPGRDFEVVAVVHSGGGFLTVKDESYNGAGVLLSGRNQFQGQVEALMARGVKFYFCQNTTRAYLNNGYLPKYADTGLSATDQLIDGMEYTTAGVSAIADLQKLGYLYIQP